MRGSDERQKGVNDPTLGVVILEGLERFGPVAFPSPEKFIWT